MGEKKKDGNLVKKVLIICIVLVVGGISTKIKIDNSPKKIRLEVGETLEILCENQEADEDSIELPIDAPEYMTNIYDLVSYDEIGVVTHAFKNLEAGGSFTIDRHTDEIKFSLVKGEYLNVKIPSNLKKHYKITKNPVFNTYFLNKGENVEIVNSDEAYMIIGVNYEDDGSQAENKKYDYIKYDENGAVIEEVKNEAMDFICIGKDEKIIITNNENEKFDLCIPVDFGDCAKKGQ